MTFNYQHAIGYGAPLSKKATDELSKKMGVSTFYELRDSELLWKKEFPDVRIIATHYSGELYVYAMAKATYITPAKAFEVNKLPEDMFQDKFRQQLEDFLNHYEVEADGEVEPVIVSHAF